MATFKPPQYQKSPDNDLERRLVELPIGLRKWLALSNGAGGFFGIKIRLKLNDIEHQWLFWAGMEDRGWIPVASDNPHIRFFRDETANVDV